jgi:hypothetical protein
LEVGKMRHLDVRWRGRGSLELCSAGRKTKIWEIRRAGLNCRSNESLSNMLSESMVSRCGTKVPPHIVHRQGQQRDLQRPEMSDSFSDGRRVAIPQAMCERSRRCGGTCPCKQDKVLAH